MGILEDEGTVSYLDCGAGYITMHLTKTAELYIQKECILQFVNYILIFKKEE